MKNYNYSRLHLYFNRIVRLIVSFFPRDRKLIVYGGAVDCFIDNAKHLFIYNYRNPRLQGYQQVWLTRNDATFHRVANLGYKVIKSNSIKGIWYNLRCGYLIYDYRPEEFASYVLAEGSTKINLWHGIAVKSWGAALSAYDPFYEPNKYSFIERFWKEHENGDYIVSTALFLDRLTSVNASIPKDHLIRATYPRVLVLQMNDEDREKFIFQNESKEFVKEFNLLKSVMNRKVIYMPTFRDNDVYYIDKAIPDWTLLNDFCVENGITFYLKVHRVTPLPEIDSFSNIKCIDNTIDIYPLLNSFDLLVTDYSSIMYDFALTNRPILLYTYDLDEYQTRSRRMYPHYKELRDAVSHVDDFSSLLNGITMDIEQFKIFPTENSFDCPTNIESINDIILKSDR